MAQTKKDYQPVKELFEDVLDILKKSHEPQPVDADVDVDHLIHEMQASLTQIQERAEELYKRSGMSKEQIEAFAANPNNFSQEEWALLQQIRSETADFQHRTEALLINSTPTSKTPSTPSKPAEKSSAKRVSKKEWKPS